MIEFNHIVLQYGRLVRHAQSALRTNDPIAYLDLAHSLRVWIEMKGAVQRYIDQLDIEIVFGHAPRSKKLKRVLAGSDYRVMPLSSGVPTAIGSLSAIVITDRVLSDDELRDLPRLPDAQPSAFTFSEWLGAEIYSDRIPDDEGQLHHFGISREVFVKRVANILGGSHPQGADLDEDGLENRADPYLRGLLRMSLGDRFVPAPFAQIQEIAGDIIENLEPVFDPKGSFHLQVEYKTAGISCRVRGHKSVAELFPILQDNAMKKRTTSVFLDGTEIKVAWVQAPRWSPTIDFGKLLLRQQGSR